MIKPKVIIYDNDGMMTRGGRFSEHYAREFDIEIAALTPFFDGPFKKCLVGEADLKGELQKVLATWGWKGTVNELLDYWFAIGDDVDTDMYASIAKLKKQGLIVCIATNNEKYRTKYLSRKLLYDKVLDHVFSSAELGAYKQSVEGLEQISQILRNEFGVTDKREVMYWDDRAANIQNLNNGGFNAQHYRGYGAFRSVMAKYGFQV